MAGDAGGGGVGGGRDCGETVRTGEAATVAQTFRTASWTPEAGIGTQILARVAAGAADGGVGETPCTTGTAGNALQVEEGEAERAAHTGRVGRAVGIGSAVLQGGRVVSVAQLASETAGRIYS